MVMTVLSSLLVGGGRLRYSLFKAEYKINYSFCTFLPRIYSPAIYSAAWILNSLATSVKSSYWRPSFNILYKIIMLTWDDDRWTANNVSSVFFMIKPSGDWHSVKHVPQKHSHHLQFHQNHTLIINFDNYSSDCHLVFSQIEDNTLSVILPLLRTRDHYHSNKKLFGRLVNF